MNMMCEYATVRSSFTRACKLFVLAIFSMFAFEAAAQVTDPDVSLNERYPAGSIKSLEMADIALGGAARERSRIEAVYTREEQACHMHFFATSCIDEAKERRRQALSRVRPIEIEANTFKRQARATSRDQVLAKKQVQAAQDQRRQPDPQSETGNDPSVKAEGGSEDVKALEASRNVQATIFPDRRARHEAKLKCIQAQESADAQKRAENVAAYEKKVQEAEARQRKLQERKAKKEKKRLNEPALQAPQ